MTYKSTGVRLVLILVVVAAAFLSTARVQAQDCGEDQVCVDRDRAARFLKAGETVRCLEKTLEKNGIEVTAQPYRIIVDKEGRVFAPDDMKLRVSWCDFEFDLIYEPEVDIHRRPDTEPKHGVHFRFRIGAGFQFVPHGNQSYGNPRSLIDPLILVESFYWRWLHAEAHLGLNTFGAGIGVDITDNLDVYSGVGLRWSGLKEVSPVLGLSVALN